MKGWTARAVSTASAVFAAGGLGGGVTGALPARAVSAVAPSAAGGEIFLALARTTASATAPAMHSAAGLRMARGSDATLPISAGNIATFGDCTSEAAFAAHPPGP